MIGRGEGQTIIRLKQMTFGSQVKAVLVLAVPTTAVLFILFVLFQAAGAGLAPSDGPFIVMLVCAITSGVFAAMIAVVQIAALGLLRLLPWRGPELKVEEPKHLAGIFE